MTFRNLVQRSGLPLALVAATIVVGCGSMDEPSAAEEIPCGDVSLPVASSAMSAGSTREQYACGDGETCTSAEALSQTPADDSVDVLIESEDENLLRIDAIPSTRMKSLLQLDPRQSTKTFAARVTRDELEALQRDPSVRRLEWDRPVYAMALNSEIPWGVARVGAPQVWDVNADGAFDPGAPTGQGIRVCVIDTGIDPTHPELRGVYRGGHDFVDDDDDPTDATGILRGSGHGTHVAATIAAQLGSNGNGSDTTAPMGVVGVAPGIELYAVRVLDTDGTGKTSDTINAIRWCAERGAHIATLSLGSKDASEMEQEAFQQAYDRGMLILGATGNSGNAKPVAFPAAYDSVIAVGATDTRDSLAGFSQTGPQVELVAPGVNIVSATLVNGGVIPSLSVGGEALEVSAMSGPGTIEDEVIPCGLGDSVHSCEQIRCDGFVAFVKRGGVKFSEKVRNVMAQGATAVIVANDNDEDPDDPGRFTLGSGGPWPPVVSVSSASGERIEEQLQLGTRARVELRGIDYVRMSGTSMATPHATGVAALMWSARPELTNRGVRALLQATAIDLGVEGPDDQYGYGLVQATLP